MAAKNVYRLFQLTNCSFLSLFHSGAAHPDLEKGMKDEHCTMAGCDVPFDEGNYSAFQTTQKLEFEITMGLKECPEDKRRDKRGQVVREVKKIEDLMELKVAKDAKLRKEEVAAVVSRPARLSFRWRVEEAIALYLRECWREAVGFD